METVLAIWGNDKNHPPLERSASWKYFLCGAKISWLSSSLSNEESWLYLQIPNPQLIKIDRNISTMKKEKDKKRKS